MIFCRKIVSVLAFLFLILLTQSVFSQDEFIEETVSVLLFEEVNKLREKEGLHLFVEDEILDAVAFDQAEYILKLGKITHEQEQEKKKTLRDRILYYEGLYAEAGENAVVVGVGSKEQIEPNGPRIIISTEENAVKAAITAWLDEEEGRLNLLDPNFYHIGIAVIVDEDKEITFVFVAASLPYEAPDYQKIAHNFHGIEPYSSEVCKSFLETHSSLPQLFSDAIKVENNEVFFEYHSLDYMLELLDNASDGIAVDIVRDDQYGCKTGNRLFPTEINDGYLLPPSKKMKLTNYNLLKDKGEVKFSLGKLPDFYSAQNCELNAIIIKKGHYCETSPFNHLETKNVKWFDLPFLLVGDTDSSHFFWKDSSQLSIVIDAKGEWEREFLMQFKFRKEIDYQFSSMRIKLKVSPIADREVLIANVKSLAESIGNKLDYSIDIEDSWSEYYDFQKNTFHQLETDGKDTVEIIEYLKSQTDEKLVTFLNSLNRVEINLEGTAVISNQISDEVKVTMLKELIANQKITPASYLQASLIKDVLSKKANVSVVPIIDHSQKKKVLPLINNQIVLQQGLGKKIYDGNPIYLAFLELFLIDRSQQEIAYNKYISELKHWSINFKNISNFESWQAGFKGLLNKVPSIMYAKAWLNYQLIAADYYYEKGEFIKRKKAFDEIMKWQTRAKLNSAEILNLAKYLCYQDQFSRAIELLKPIVQQENVDEDILFYFLQISIYDEEQVSSKLQLESVQKAQELYPKGFCQLFSKEKMGIQLLKKNKIKALYCSQCME